MTFETPSHIAHGPDRGSSQRDERDGLYRIEEHIVLLRCQLGVLGQSATASRVAAFVILLRGLHACRRTRIKISAAVRRKWHETRGTQEAPGDSRGVTHEEHDMMERIKVCDPRVEPCTAPAGECAWNVCASSKRGQRSLPVSGLPRVW